MVTLGKCKTNAFSNKLSFCTTISSILHLKEDLGHFNSPLFHRSSYIKTVPVDFLYVDL